jgi:phage baseplate assembly protein W
VSSAISYPYNLDTNGVVTSVNTTTKLYLDRVLTLLSTNVGQRPMMPDYGTDWSTTLFENENNYRRAIPVAISNAIRTWIPDVSVEKVELSGDEYSGIVYVNLFLKLPNNTIATMKINTATFNYDGLVTR